MRSPRFVLFFILVALLLDLYVFQALKAITQGMTPRLRITVFTLHWSISAAALLALVLTSRVQLGPRTSSYIIAVILGLYIAKLVAAVFLLIDDIRRLVQWTFNRLTRPEPAGSDAISRSTFLSWVSAGLGTAVFSSFLYGFTNKYNYRIQRLKLAFDNLPASFKGLKIIQISDIHSGSLANPQAVARGVDMILAERPDLILFTGDLVNNEALEMNDYQSIFSRLQAPMGVYSTLGNHDYGDYIVVGDAGSKKSQFGSCQRDRAADGMAVAHE